MTALPNSVHAHFADLQKALDATAAHADTVARWAAELAAMYAAGGRLLTCGNGGSAAEAQHLSGELVGRFHSERAPLSAIALHADTSAGTAIVNDYGEEQLFSRQVRAHAREGDTLIALSTSGTSRNVLAAAKTAQEAGVKVWALTGPAPNPLATMADDAIPVDATSVATIQEVHLALVHVLCAALDEQLGVPG
ncbi:SIS domain-containing protein [Hoyosella sp. YIM 151337]|uniref:D-sedoheptulose-7-phosphate isomerase n=1 Tax=Hoyosella sp. YIM 151337 TaxID=2992742 RepID=UPI002235D707|nr:SIS domain-containing protein [Hoyosella sp. YIM 151337]MCW4355508.1 SIS domain-containing protein [Hoyosella sp. YIM 151337]